LQIRDLPLPVSGLSINWLPRLSSRCQDCTQEAKNVFFQKGDRVTISFDANNFKDSMKFEGKNTPVIDHFRADNNGNFGIGHVLHVEVYDDIVVVLL